MSRLGRCVNCRKIDEIGALRSKVAAEYDIDCKVVSVELCYLIEDVLAEKYGNGSQPTELVSNRDYKATCLFTRLISLPPNTAHNSYFFFVINCLASIEWMSFPELGHLATSNMKSCLNWDSRIVSKASVPANASATLPMMWAFKYMFSMAGTS